MTHNLHWLLAARHIPSDVIVGTMDDDTLTGTSDADTLYGNGGDDRLYGGDGDDVLRGGDGRDTLYGGLGDDTLYGSKGSEVMYGEEGDDLLLAGNGDSDLDGGAGNDTLQANGGHYNFLEGGDGNDVVLGSDRGGSFKDRDNDVDTLLAGAGRDELYADWSAATADIVWINDPSQRQIVNGHVLLGMDHLNLTLGAGNDVVDNRLSGEETRTDIHGGYGNDKLTGSHSTPNTQYGVGIDHLYGDAGNDTLTAVGNAHLSGGATTCCGGRANTTCATAGPATIGSGPVQAATR